MAPPASPLLSLFSCHFDQINLTETYSFVAITLVPKHRLPFSSDWWLFLMESLWFEASQRKVPVCLFGVFISLTCDANQT